MNVLNTALQSLHIIQQFEEQNKAQDDKGRTYLSLKDGSLTLTTNKTEQASSEALFGYVSSLMNNLTSLPESKTVIAQLDSSLRRLLPFYEDPTFIELDNVLHTYSVPIEPENPFYQHDVLVFKDSYAGLLPLNGMKEKEFLAISRKLTHLKAHNRIRGLRLAEMEPNSSEAERARYERKRELIFNDIVTLCTRKNGRQLINILIDQNIPVNIVFLTEKHPTASCSFAITSLHDIRVDVYCNPDHRSELGIYGTNELMLIPNYIVLGHELIHAQHFITDSSSMRARKEEPHKTMHSMEEYFTILGWEIEPGFLINQTKSAQKDDANSDEEKDFTTSLDYTQLWDEKSENALRANFSLLPRSQNYYQGSVNTLETKKREFLEKAENESFDFKTACKALQKSAETEMDPQEFLNQILLSACEGNKWKIAVKLLDVGAQKDLLPDTLKSKIQNHYLLELFLNNADEQTNLTKLGAIPVPSIGRQELASIVQSQLEENNIASLTHVEWEKYFSTFEDWIHFVLEEIEKCPMHKLSRFDTYAILAEKNAQIVSLEKFQEGLRNIALSLADEIPHRLIEYFYINEDEIAAYLEPLKKSLELIEDKHFNPFFSIFNIGDEDLFSEALELILSHFTLDVHATYGDKCFSLEVARLQPACMEKLIDMGYFPCPIGKEDDFFRNLLFSIHVLALLHKKGKIDFNSLLSKVDPNLAATVQELFTLEQERM